MLMPAAVLVVLLLGAMAFDLSVVFLRQRQASSLKAQALRCRRLAQSVTDTRTVATLKAMAAEYDEKARSLVAG